MDLRTPLPRLPFRASRSFDELDARITGFMARAAIPFLRVSLGLIFIWFGALKLVPGASPAEGLVLATLELLTPTWVDPRTGVVVLAAWEVAIGLGLLTGRFLRATLLLLFVQMIGTVSPVVLMPGEVFARPPLALTLEGQYIVKNLALVSGALVLGATVRGGGLVAEREAPRAG